MKRPSLEQLTAVIKDEWDKSTSSTPIEWSLDNAARGQCVPTSLVVQDFYGGDIVRVAGFVNGQRETHYFNEIDSKAIDLTGAQYGPDIIMSDASVNLEAEGYMSMRDRLISNAYTNTRYELLRNRVLTKLAKGALTNE